MKLVINQFSCLLNIFLLPIQNILMLLATRTPSQVRISLEEENTPPYWPGQGPQMVCFPSIRATQGWPWIILSVRMAFNGLGVRFDQRASIANKLTERIFNLMQRISAKGKRIHRYSERVELF